MPNVGVRRTRTISSASVTPSSRKSENLRLDGLEKYSCTSVVQHASRSLTFGARSGVEARGRTNSSAESVTYDQRDCVRRDFIEMDATIGLWSRYEGQPVTCTNIRARS